MERKIDFETLCPVGLDNFSSDVLGEVRPVLLLCLSKDASLEAQISEAEKVHQAYWRSLKTCLLKEDFLGAFMERYRVRGTPTFLIFSNGEERQRLLGKSSYQDLQQFIVQTLPGLVPDIS